MDNATGGLTVHNVGAGTLTPAQQVAQRKEARALRDEATKRLDHEIDRNFDEDNDRHKQHRREASSLILEAAESLGIGDAMMTDRTTMNRGITAYKYQVEYIDDNEGVWGLPIPWKGGFNTPEFNTAIPGLVAQELGVNNYEQFDDWMDNKWKPTRADHPGMSDGEIAQLLMNPRIEQAVQSAMEEAGLSEQEQREQRVATTRELLKAHNAQSQ